MISPSPQFFDGWEMNGKVFPSEHDHSLPTAARAREMCGGGGLTAANVPPTMYSSQNAALVQFKIPTPGEGFSFRVSFVQNPDRELSRG